MIVFVQNMHGKPLMPCKPQKARKLLQHQKAKVISYRPFTIQLLYGSYGYTQSTDIGVDLGAKHIGVAIVSHDKVLDKGEIELRQDVKSNLETRKILRRSRRSRKTRYRRCKFKHKTKRVYDPKKKKWIKKKVSFESKRPDGWLSPSLQSRIHNTFYWIDKYASLLPKCTLHMEVGKFDIQKMINPSIQGVEYQQGLTLGYYDVRYFVFARDNYTCQLCKKKGKILQTHHVIFKSHGGSDRADNLITLCTDCHTHENHKEGNILWTWMQKKKKVSTYKEPPFMNSLRKRVFQKYPDAIIAYGSITTPSRKALGLSKTHYNDAIAITGIETIKKNPNSMFYIKQFRKKKRSLHEATARKGRKEKNRTQKRNEKNTKCSGGFFLNDKVKVFETIGFISGFASGCAYVKDIQDNYITKPGKSYKQIGLADLTCVYHQNNWQFIPSLAPYGS